MKSTTKAWLGLSTVSAIIALILFVGAGTIHYWQAWLYLAVMIGASLLQTWYLVREDPALLERRIRGGPRAEKERAQKIIMRFTGGGYVLMFILSALGHRNGWSSVPPWFSIAAVVIVLIGYAVIFFVFKENTFAAATVEIAPDQRVISTGPYALVRHPMYVGGLLYMVATPLALGSYWGLLGFGLVLPAMIWRIFDEERLLARELPGYTEYCAKVRWRLIPGVF